MRWADLDADTIAALQTIQDQLRAQTDVFRTTFRLDIEDSEEFFPVVAESLGEGADSMIEHRMGFDLRDTATFQYINRGHDLLVQSDCTKPPLPNQELVKKFDTWAQMLAPLVQANTMIGILSVHHQGAPRQWTDEEITALEKATDATHETLFAHSTD
jgi:GAF domain-containing protein